MPRGRRSAVAPNPQPPPPRRCLSAIHFAAPTTTAASTEASATTPTASTSQVVSTVGSDSTVQASTISSMTLDQLMEAIGQRVRQEMQDYSAAASQVQASQATASGKAIVEKKKCMCG